VRKREKEGASGMSWQSAQRRGVEAGETGERERKTQDLFDT